MSSTGGIHSNYLLFFTPLGPRTRGVKAKLLGREKLSALIYAESLDDVVNILRDTSYRAVVEKFGKEFTSGEFMREVKTAVIKDIVDLALMCPIATRTTLITYLLKFEIDNVKIIAKGLHEGKDRRDIEKLVNVYVEEVLGRRHVLAYILGARDLEDLGAKLKELAHPAAEFFEHIMKLIKLKPELTLCAIDTLLDRAYLERLYNTIMGIYGRDVSILHVIRCMINYYNLNILLRGKLWNLPLELVNEFVIKAGYIGTNFARLYAETLTRIFDELSTDPVVSTLMSVARVSEIENAVQYLSLINFKAFSKIASEILARYGEFAPGAALAISHLKDLESDLIISITNAFIEGIPKDLIRKYLSIVL